MKVKAAPGLQVPKEGQPRDYITGSVEVPRSAYYLRLVADGDLIEVGDKQPARKKGGE